MHSRIKMIRQNEGLTQSQFADKIGLSRNYVAMIEIGQRGTHLRATLSRKI